MNKDRINRWFNDMIDNMMTIRVNQVQMSSENKWPQEYIEKCDIAWNNINRIGKLLDEELSNEE